METQHEQDLPEGASSLAIKSTYFPEPCKSLPLAWLTGALYCLLF